MFSNRDWGYPVEDSCEALYSQLNNSVCRSNPAPWSQLWSPVQRLYYQGIGELPELTLACIHGPLGSWLVLHYLIPMESRPEPHSIQQVVVARPQQAPVSLLFVYRQLISCSWGPAAVHSAPTCPSAKRKMMLLPIQLEVPLLPGEGCKSHGHTCLWDEPWPIWCRLFWSQSLVIVIRWLTNLLHVSSPVPGSPFLTESHWCPSTPEPTWTLAATEDTHEAAAFQQATESVYF